MVFFFCHDFICILYTKECVGTHMGALSGWRIREGYLQRRHKTKTGKSDCNEVLR